MPSIAKYGFTGEATIVGTTLDGATDTIDGLQKARNSVLVIENSGVADVTIELLGDGVTAIDCPGVGVIDPVGEKPLEFTILAGQTQKFPLNPNYSKYFGDTGIVYVTGGTADLSAYVLEQ